MSKPKLSRTSSAADTSDPAQQQLWHEFVRSIRKIHSSQSDTPDSTDLYAEKANLDSAIDQLSSLIRLKRSERTSHPPPTALVTSINTPTAGAGTPGSTAGGGVKRKRRQSVSASPAPQTAVDAAPALAVPAAAARGGTPMSRELTKSKKRPWADQLPFAPGRHVAFRESSEGEENWILAAVVRMVKDDPRRYIVCDVDEKEKTFTASLKDLIPLPDDKAPANSSANPKNLEDFPEGQQVLAVYPGTTSFYRATVVCPPLAGTGHGRGLRQPMKKPANPRKLAPVAQSYLLEFVDDDANVNTVAKNEVVLHPSVAGNSA